MLIQKNSNAKETPPTRRCQAASICESYLHEEKSYIPMIRLKVELHGNDMFDRHRFSTQFKGLVANPNDMLSISRKTGRREEIEVHQPDEEKVEITHILRKILGNVEFGVLNRLCFSESLEEYVRGDSNAFMGMIRKNIEKVIDTIDHSSIVDEDVIKAMKKISREEDRSYDAEHVRTEENMGVSDGKEIETSSMDKKLEGGSLCHSSDSNEGSESRIKKNFALEDLIGRKYLGKRVRKNKEDSSTDVSFTFSKYL
ncbi:DNA repair protein Mre11 [Encephalitozoon romaleae SJ-2008]|uniref:DNA repair protein Mre11 n=1 Tax=Encephalitozoon romaleae (strain SJ-2008) TaxID=1178016 RepID=I7AEH0_ENCRO|nr:DNA repair protein Mre11 [Encephalitozoon romaleae SJ-2008]AFN83065.1 DNA repair protein Mre11 [Encephalitozoon romaleae SJ-2008]